MFEIEYLEIFLPDLAAVNYIPGQNCNKSNWMDFGLYAFRTYLVHKKHERRHKAYIYHAIIKKKNNINHIEPHVKIQTFYSSMQSFPRSFSTKAYSLRAFWRFPF